MQIHERYDSQKCQLSPGEIIVGTTPLPLLKGWVRTFQKLRDKLFLLERGDKPVKREVDVEIGGRGGCHFFATLQFSSLTFTLSLSLSVWVCVWVRVRGGGGSKVSPYYFLDLQSFELAMQDFHPRSD